MLKSYVVPASRFFANNWRHIVINILGLATGLFVFFLASSMQEHERNHDGFFQDAENIYGVYTRVLPQAGYGTSRVFGSAPVAGPLIAENIAGIEAASRYIEDRQAIRVENNSYYESVKFVDPDFTNIFSFEFIADRAQDALDSGSGLILTREAAMRYFGRVDVVGQVIRLGGRLDMAVAGVIENLPANSHFVYRFGTTERMQVIAPISALENLEGTGTLNNWGAVSDRNRLWLKLSPAVNPDQLGIVISDFLQDFVDENGQDIIAGFSLLSLTEWNLSALDANGISLVSVAVVLAAIVLVVAVLNYSNLFTAMLARRLRELAIRKTLGATRYQLSAQLFVESVLLTTLAASIAFVAVAAALPPLAATIGKEIQFSNLLSWNLLATVLLVIIVSSILSVAYPVYIVNRLATARTLQGLAFRGRSGARLRSSLVMLQFALNAILGTLMATTFLQNQHMLQSNPGFESEDVIILSGIANPEVNDRQDTLIDRLQNIPGVDTVAGASQHPFQEIHVQGRYTTDSGDSPEAVSLYRFSVGEDFFNLYGIDIVNGRTLNRATNNDAIRAEIETPVINVVLNRQALEPLGLTSTSEAIDQVFYSISQDQPRQAFRIVGVVENANLLGLANDIKPSVFRFETSSFTSLSLKFESGAPATVLNDINSAWAELFPELPVQSAYLQETFQARFQIFTGINFTLIILSLVSLLLATSGLYGLVSVLAERRKHELAIRKVIGATIRNLVQLLLWQFTKPIGLALLLGTPLGILAGAQYLSLFADRINGVTMIGLGVSFAILALAWLTITGQIYGIAQNNPADDLRSE